MPMLSKVGSSPIRAVAIPIMRSDSISMVLRPILSPKWPKTSPPMGLATKPTAYVEAEVIPFDGRPDKAGRRHLAYRGSLPLLLSTQSLHTSLLCLPEPDPDSGPPVPTVYRILLNPWHPTQPSQIRLPALPSRPRRQRKAAGPDRDPAPPVVLREPLEF